MCYYLDNYRPILDKSSCFCCCYINKKINTNK